MVAIRKFDPYGSYKGRIDRKLKDIQNTPGTTTNPFGEQSNEFATNTAKNVQTALKEKPKLDRPVFEQESIFGENGLGTQTELVNEVDRIGQIASEGLQNRYNKHSRLENQRELQSTLNSFQNQDWGNSGGSINGPFGGLGADQSQYASQIINIGKKRGLSDNQIIIGLMTGLTESGLRNVNYGDRDSVGLFQQRTSQGWGSIQEIMNPKYSINTFYDALLRTNTNGLNPWQSAQAVQRSAFADGSNYQKYYQQAQGILNAYRQASSQNQNGATGKNQSYNWIQRNNNKYHDYDGAYGAQCVDLYAYYTSGFAGGNPIPVGGAKELWHTYDPGAYTRVGSNNRTQMGDVAVFGGSMGGGYGHVGIVVGDNGNGTLRLLQANATSLGPNGNTVISNISKAALLGYLRPNRLRR